MNRAKNEVICAKCGKAIPQRRRFKLVLEVRPRYRSHYNAKEIGLYFHEHCIKNISVRVSDLWDLIRVLNKLGASQEI